MANSYQRNRLRNIYKQRHLLKNQKIVNGHPMTNAESKETPKVPDTIHENGPSGTAASMTATPTTAAANNQGTAQPTVMTMQRAPAGSQNVLIMKLEINKSKSPTEQQPNPITHQVRNFVQQMHTTSPNALLKTTKSHIDMSNPQGMQNNKQLGQEL